MAQLPLFPVDSPVSLSVQPGSEKARQTTATSGRRCIASYAHLLPDGSWQRTFLASLVSMGAWCSSLCVLTWNVRATPFKRLLFQLRASVRRTSDSGCSLLPTMRANKWGLPDSHGSTKAWGLWATPTAQDDNKSPEAHMAMKARMKGGPRYKPTSLKVQVRMWPTPNRADGEGGPGNSGRDGGNDNRKGASKTSGDGLATRIGGQLNPQWVEWLQGFPGGWTDLDA